MDALSTGISVLDRQFGGGLPAGSVVALKAEPASQSELLLERFARPRPCRYLTTVRSVDAVESELEGAGSDTTVAAVDEEDPLGEVLEAGGALGDNETLVVDSIGPLEETDAARYGGFLGDLRQRVVDIDGVAVLHALKGGPTSQSRIVSEQIADVVLDLRTTVTGTEIANRLVVPKFRGGAALEEPLKLKLTDTVTIDTSRDIA
ncbi:transcriptional regulator [Halorubrum sp. CBA1125]|uniref:RAD55 family ATPase n=1 Tax=Halorubrum sp. CBA1125 TaxID=2668072 RepID=UPI0012E7981D|nr:transcriptional regulator [Halorubrum sp. CBA1125]MUW13549.1 transcriptional regulator [Halorubrum sp. CBA1125]